MSPETELTRMSAKAPRELARRSGEVRHGPVAPARSHDAVELRLAADAADDEVGGVALVEAHGRAAAHGVEVDGVEVAGRVDEHRARDGVDGRLAERAGRRDVARDAVGAECADELADLHVARHGVDGEVAGQSVDDDVARDGVEPCVVPDARDQRARAHDAEVESDGAGDRDADLGLRAARAEVAEHFEEVVPAQLRVVDLDGIAGDFDAEILDGDAVHLDAGAGFVVGDDVDLSADEADLERSDGFDVDDSSLAGVDDPLLQGHCFSSRV